MSNLGSELYSGGVDVDIYIIFRNISCRLSLFLLQENPLNFSSNPVP